MALLDRWPAGHDRPAPTRRHTTRDRRSPGPPRPGPWPSGSFHFSSGSIHRPRPGSARLGGWGASLRTGRGGGWYRLGSGVVDQVPEPVGAGPLDGAGGQPTVLPAAEGFGAVVESALGYEVVGA